MMFYGQKQEPYKNYFPVHNRIFDLGLCAEELAIYLYLVRCEDKETYSCYPSYSTIGESIGRSENSVRKYVRQLEKKRFIITESTLIKTKEGRYHNGTLRYTIRPIQDAIDYFDEQQMQRLVEAKIKREREEALRKYDEKRKKIGRSDTTDCEAG